MVWGKSGKSVDELLNEHPLVEKGSVKWYLDDTTNPKTVILQFSCFTVSKELVKELVKKYNPTSRFALSHITQMGIRFMATRVACNF